MESKKLSAAVTGTAEANKEAFLSLLISARLPVSNVVFSVEKSTSHSGYTLVARLFCTEGHALVLTMDEVQESLANQYFNDLDIVPCLCKFCAYPGNAVAQKKATVYHRLALLRKVYPEVVYISGFDTSSTGHEEYNCGNHFNDGASHPSFSIRYDKLKNADKAGDLRHFCYVCGVAASQIPESKSKTLAMFTGRMKVISERIAEISKGRPHEPFITFVDQGESDISTTKTKLNFHCGHPLHDPVTSTVDNYFKSAKGGYCKKCLADAHVNSSVELLLKV